MMLGPAYINVVSGLTDLLMDIHISEILVFQFVAVVSVTLQLQWLTECSIKSFHTWTNCICRYALTARSDVRAIDNSLPVLCSVPRGVGGQLRMTYFSPYIHVILIQGSHTYIFLFYCLMFVVQMCQSKCCGGMGCSRFSTMGRRLFVCIISMLLYLWQHTHIWHNLNS